MEAQGAHIPHGTGIAAEASKEQEGREKTPKGPKRSDPAGTIRERGSARGSAQRGSCAGIARFEENVWQRGEKRLRSGGCKLEFAAGRDGGDRRAVRSWQKYFAAPAGRARHANERYSILRKESH